jgi:hypothetical protein
METRKRHFYFALITILALSPMVNASETQLRVAFVYNFIKFIDWPELATPATINLCAISNDKETRDALNALNGKVVNNLTIALTYFNAGENTPGSCQLLYLPDLLPEPIHYASDKGLVLISDNTLAQNLDASITLARNDEGRIEFYVNPNALSRTGVRISSQLLKLAKKTPAQKDQPHG